MQEADFDELRSITFGVLRERFPLENTQPIVAQLAADTCQHGAITVSNFPGVSFDSEQCKITATVNFEQAPSSNVRSGLIERLGR